MIKLENGIFKPNFLSIKIQNLGELEKFYRLEEKLNVKHFPKW